MPVKKASKTGQARNHDILTYVPLRFLYSVFDRHRDVIKAWAFCYHDCDTWNEEDDVKNPDHVAGTLKEPHFHVILRFYRPVRFSTVCSWFYCLDDDEIPITTRSIACDSVADRYAYLIHNNDPDKFQYPLKNRVCSDESLFLNVYDDFTDSLTDALFDSLDGVSSYQLLKRYGRDFLMNHERLYALRGRIVAEPSYLRERAEDARLIEVKDNPF